MKKLIMVCLFVTIFALICAPVSYADGPMNKLGRGLLNVLVGWTEVPKAMVENFENNNDNMIAALAAIPRGVFKTLTRTTVGVFEMATFPLPIPADYKPIVNPEFIIEGKQPHQHADAVY